MSIPKTGTIKQHLIFAVCIFGASLASAQQATEQYIPIGQSPGVSGTYSYVGRIIATDRDTHMISIDGRSGVRRVLVTERTRIWFDRSKSNSENTVANYDDCEVGARVEVMHIPDDETTATWIKIEVR